MNHLEAAHHGGGAGRSVISITLVCFAVSMIDGFDNLVLSFVAPLLAKSLEIDHASLGRVFGAGFVGTVLGSLIIGPLADRFGRRKMLVLALIVTGGFTMACAFANSAGTLAALRFLGGLGMGGAIPPIAAITAESASSERRSSLVILMFIGYPLGAVVGGAITAALMMKFGWPFVFLMGGACALAAIIPVLLVIPGEATTNSVMQASNGFMSDMMARFVGDLFAEGRFAATIALWFGVLASMILSSFLASFIPTILNLNGVAPDRAALGVVVFNVGAITGALLISLIVRRGAPFVAVAVAFVAGAAMVFTLGRVIGAGNAAFGLLFVMGACIVGGQLTFPAIASCLYPAGVRTVGVGWTAAIGRTGSSIGPVVGGVLLAQNWSLGRLFLAAAMLALLAALGIAFANLWRPRGEGMPRHKPFSKLMMTGQR
ncbi:MFS transporter [Burkholderia sp. BCC0405]|uniref:MFS transporter n=1 Tax=Burkholderia sp. BCC0405 TaxID=2676298 RepID=UPI00158AD832|nr:MFS transporter [Burkholderia sp. BCC0405]